jgi:hypothetical protein
MDAVDGNAIGGLLIDVFGTEMTAANSICGICGASRPVAELVVYRQAPGTVVRCRTCRQPPHTRLGSRPGPKLITSTGY